MKKLIVLIVTCLLVGCAYRGSIEVETRTQPLIKVEKHYR